MVGKIKVDTNRKEQNPKDIVQDVLMACQKMAEALVVKGGMLSSSSLKDSLSTAPILPTVR